MRRSRGFTLIELLVVMAIIGILTKLVIPNINVYLTNEKIRRISDEMAVTLAQARSSALSLNTQVNLTITGTSWTMTTLAMGGNPSVTLATRTGGKEETVLAITPSPTTVSFTPYGRNLAGATTTLSVSSPTAGTCAASGGAVRCLQVNVFAGGQTKMCDPKLASTNPAGC